MNPSVPSDNCSILSPPIPYSNNGCRELIRLVFFVFYTLIIVRNSPKIVLVLLMLQILHYLKEPKLWDLWYFPYYG